MSLPPPPIQAWSEMPTVWKRWFLEVFRNSGGTEATPVDDLELAINMVREAPTESASTDDNFLFLDSPKRVDGQSGWNDILAAISPGSGVGANAPNWTTLRDGISAYAFDNILMHEVWVNLHILHDYKWGSKVWPHIHWTTAGTDTGVCRWGIEYTYARSYGVEAFPTTTTIYLEQAATGTAYTHMLAEPAEADGILLPNCEPDGVLLCRVFRDATHANDTLTDDAYALFADLHFESDGFLTNERNTGFTKRRT